MNRTIESLTGALAALVLLSGCGGSSSQGPERPPVSPPTSSSPASSLQATAAARAPGTVAAPTAAVSPSPTATSATGTTTVNPAGAVLPNRARTPGAVNPAVNQANIGQTICVTGWTATIRPPPAFTTRLKQEQLATGYTDKGDTATGDYEEDHRISLEIGGAPNAEATLWPEPYNSPEGPGSRTSWRTRSTPWQRPSGPSQPTGGPPTRPTSARPRRTRTSRPPLIVGSRPGQKPAGHVSAVLADQGTVFEPAATRQAPSVGPTGYKYILVA